MVVARSIVYRSLSNSALARDVPIIEPKVSTASAAPTSSLRGPSTSLVTSKRRPAKWPYAALTVVAMLFIAYGALFFAHKPPPVDNMGFPSKWKSTMSGSVRTLRFQGNYIYGEVLLPEAAAMSQTNPSSELPARSCAEGSAAPANPGSQNMSQTRITGRC